MSEIPQYQPPENVQDQKNITQTRNPFAVLWRFRKRMGDSLRKLDQRLTAWEQKKQAELDEKWRVLREESSNNNGQNLQENNTNPSEPIQFDRFPWGRYPLPSIDSHKTRADEKAHAEAMKRRAQFKIIK